MFALVFAAAGLFAHTVFLVLQGKLVLGSTGLWLGSWFGWCLATAWILAIAYIWISARQPKSVIGLFLIPLILGLIGLGVGFGHENQFSSMRAKSIWNMVHGSALLLGTAVVALGFVFGVGLCRPIAPPKTQEPSVKVLSSAVTRVVTKIQ